MTAFQIIQSNITKLLVFVFIIKSSACFDAANNKSVVKLGPTNNPCYGRHGGFARDLTSCQYYYECVDGEAHQLNCGDDRVFDADNEQCVYREFASKVCFRCSPNVQYYLVSVPHACRQYIQCMNGRPSLRLCPTGLAFDGRAGIHQCNREPSQDTCYRENPDDIEETLCPTVYDDPIYLVDNNNKSVYAYSIFLYLTLHYLLNNYYQTQCFIFRYYICWGQEKPVRAQCASDLYFSVNEGICTFPWIQ